MFSKALKQARELVTPRRQRQTEDTQNMTSHSQTPMEFTLGSSGNWQEQVTPTAVRDIGYQPNPRSPSENSVVINSERESYLESLLCKYGIVLEQEAVHDASNPPQIRSNDMMTQSTVGVPNLNAVRYTSGNWCSMQTELPQESRLHEPERLGREQPLYCNTASRQASGVFPNPAARQGISHPEPEPEDLTYLAREFASVDSRQQYHHSKRGPTPVSHSRKFVGSQGHGTSTPENLRYVSPPHYVLTQGERKMQRDLPPQEHIQMMHNFHPKSRQSRELRRSRSSESSDSGERTPRRRHHRHSSPRVELKYNGKFDFVDFQVQFDCLAEDYDWGYVTKGKRLSRCLTEGARSVLSTLDKHVRRDYDTLCGALMSLHTAPGSAGLKRNELHQAVRASGQCPSKFGTELKRLAMRAYPLRNLPEAALVQIFLKGLNDSKMQSYVALRAPESLSDAVLDACAYEAYREPEDQVLRKPKMVNATKASPTVEDQLADLTAKYEQLLLKLDTPRSSAPRPESTCFYCQGKGHFANNCPERQAAPPHVPRPSNQYNNQWNKQQNPNHRPSLISSRPSANAIQTPQTPPSIYPECNNSLNCQRLG